MLVRRIVIDDDMHLQVGRHVLLELPQKLQVFLMPVMLPAPSDFYVLFTVLFQSSTVLLNDNKFVALGRYADLEPAHCAQSPASCPLH
jgi:hypothetical protein